MNVIICTDSQSLYNRLTDILSVLAEVNVNASTKDLIKTEKIIKENNIKVLITAFHHNDKNVFKQLTKIKNENPNLVVIVLNNNPSDLYFKKWRMTGADYVFDQAMHSNKIVDVLSAIIYKNLLDALKASNTESQNPDETDLNKKQFT